MYLIVGPTEFELGLLKYRVGTLGRFDFWVTGVGPVESAISIARLLESKQADGVILFGIGGAYIGKGVNVLDICLAEEEHLGDFGIDMDGEVHYFKDKILSGRRDFDLRNNLFGCVKAQLTALRIPFKSGSFVTVHACSGTLKRANFLRDKFNGICENMEGAAVARVCDLYGIPMVELRCISNMVEDRDTSRWRVKEAIARGSEAFGSLLSEAQL